MFQTGTICFNNVLSGYASDAQCSCVSWKLLPEIFSRVKFVFGVKVCRQTSAHGKFDRINKSKFSRGVGTYISMVLIWGWHYKEKKNKHPPTCVFSLASDNSIR